MMFARLSTVKIAWTILAFALVTSAWSFAQTAPAPKAPENLVTVEPHADNRVTFRFFAPKASSVTVSGDFLAGAPPAELTKADDGLWSYTSNPIPPDSYTYNFTVDGVGVLDTRNSNFRENPNALFNFFDMPGHPETDFVALKDVPHGRVEEVLYHSGTLNLERRAHIYLPPHFEQIKGKLPVLYLLHGGGDNDISWTSAGKVNLILDNLFAEGKLKNMIVVMPSGHVPGQARGMASMFPVGPDNDRFSQDFLKDLMPFIERTYPVATGRKDRAIAGFSMGGVQTLNLALWHPDLFAYVFPMSTGFFPDAIKEIETKHQEVLAKVVKSPFTLFLFGRGKDDKLTEANNRATQALLSENKIKYDYKEMNGAHSFVFSRHFLAYIFPLLFR